MKKNQKTQEMKMIIITWNSAVEFNSRLDTIEERISGSKYKTL